MPDQPRILLITPDLMIASRLAGAAVACGWALDSIVGLGATPPATGYRVAILDLQGSPAAGGDLVAHARERLTTLGPQPDTGPALVAFGPHVAHERLAAARAAGADDVVSRGELLGAFAAVIGRHVV